MRDAAGRRLEKIGQGWSEVVYDLGNSRVLKVPNKPWYVLPRVLRKSIVDGLRRGGFRGLLASHLFHPGVLYEEVTLKVRHRKVEEIQRRIHRRQLDGKILAHPVLSGRRIEQDKIAILGDLLEQYGDSPAALSLIDRYGTFLERCFQNAVCPDGKLTLNCGSYPDGEVAQVDLGELYLWPLSGDAAEREKVTWKVSALMRRWPGSYSYVADPRLHSRVKTHLLELIHRLSEVETIRRHWGTAEGALPESRR